MARKEQVTCDVCGTLKQESNHWWRIRKSDEFMLIMPCTLSNLPYSDMCVELVHQNKDGSSQHTVRGVWEELDLCGLECLQRKVSEFTSK
jgi:hypothetical protein